MKGNFATLKKESPFYAIFENGNAPIRNWIMPNLATLEGSDETHVFMLDASRCTDDQLARIADTLAVVFGASRDEVIHEIKTRGVPIRESQVASVWSDVPAFL